MVDGGRKLNPVDNDGSDQLPFNKLCSMTHSDLDTLFGLLGGHVTVVTWNGLALTLASYARCFRAPTSSR
jgi:hypothetical protein